MVCLNENITFKKLKLQNNLIKEVTSDVDEKFHLQGLKLDEKLKTEITNKNINNIKKIIEKSIKKLFSSDYFIFLNMDDNLCSHKFKRGKYEGNFCCKKITKRGNKEKYVCTKHNKDRIPEKRIKRDINNTTKCINESTNNIVFNISSNYNMNSGFKNRILKDNNKNRIFKKKLKKNNKIFICNGGLIDFKKIFKNIL